MITITESNDELPLFINDILRKNMLESIDPELKKRLLDTKGDIVFDYQNNTFKVKTNDDELQKAIIADWKSKR